MNLALVAFLAYTGVLLAIGIWSYRIVEKVPIAKYEEEFYAAGRGLGGIVVALIIAPHINEGAAKEMGDAPAHVQQIESTVLTGSPEAENAGIAE